jgi:hypothetical protein
MTKFRELLFNQLALLTFILFSSFFLFPETIYADCMGTCSNITDSPDYPSVLGKIKNDNSNAYTNYTFGNRSPLKGIFAKSEQIATDNYEVDSENIYIAASNGDGFSGTKGSANEWKFSIVPYAWLLALNGTIGVKGQTADVNMSFGDLLDQAEFAGQLHAELFYRDKYGIFIDGTYVKLGTDSVMGPVVASTTTKIFMFEFAGIYRVYNSPTSYGESQGYKRSSVIVDLLLGGRYYNIDNKINFRSEGPINIPSISGDADWFDFMAGGRVIWQATDRWSLIARTDFAGFDFNFSSTFSWNGVGFVGFDAVDWLQILLGFRAMYTDYSDGSGDNRFVFDTWMYGPVIGLNFHN